METKVEIIKEPKKDKIFRAVNYTIMILMCLLCVGLCIYYKCIGDPNNRFLACIGVSLLFIAPILVELIFRCRVSNFIWLVYIIYSILAGILGCVLNFYNTETFALNVWYDIFIHSLAGYVFSFIGLILISRFEKYKNLNPWTIILFCFAFTLAVELVWELMEWFADSCLGQNSQGFPPEGQPAPLVTDTNIDLLCNFSGAVLFVVHFIIGKFSNVKLGIKYIENELCGNRLITRKRRKIKIDDKVDEIVPEENNQNVDNAKSLEEITNTDE